MKEKFLRLNEEKKQAILQAAISEFAECGYEKASTDHIVQLAGISKGSLFDYFGSKRNLYFDVVKIVLEHIQTIYLKKIGAIQLEDFFDALEKAIMLEYEYIHQYPLEYRLISQFIFDASGIREKELVEGFTRFEEQVIERYIIPHLDTMPLRKEVSEENVLFMTHIVIQAALKQAFEKQNLGIPMRAPEEEIKEISKYIDILKHGIYKA